MNESIANDVKCVRLDLEGGRNVPRSPDFEGRDFEAEGVRRGLDLAHLQRG
jgi:hypothetical protein